MLFNKKEDYPSCQICRISSGELQEGPSRGAGCARLCPCCPQLTKDTEPCLSPALSWPLSEHRDYFVWSGGLSSSCLSSGKEESHSSRATPRITAGNKGLILPDGARGAFWGHNSIWAATRALCVLGTPGQQLEQSHQLIYWTPQSKAGAGKGQQLCAETRTAVSCPEARALIAEYFL